MEERSPWPQYTTIGRSLGRVRALLASFPRGRVTPPECVPPQLLAGGGPGRRPVRRYAAIGPLPFTSISPRSSNA